MTSLEWLAAVAVMTALFWVPYILERMVSLGIFGALKNVEPEEELKQALWARRAKRAEVSTEPKSVTCFPAWVNVSFCCTTSMNRHPSRFRLAGHCLICRVP